MLVLVTLICILIWSKLQPKQEIVFWSAFMAIVYIIAFFFGLKPGISISILITFIGTRFFISRRIWDIESSKALLVSIPFLFTASMPTRFLDAGTYYEQSARWFEHGVPKGLGNFDIFLMQSSMAHSNEALINSLLSIGQNEVSILIGTLLLSLAFSRIKELNLVKTFIGFIVFGILVHFTQSSSSDFLIIALLLFYFLERDSFSRGNNELIAIIIILPFIKPVGAGISLLLVLELWQKTRFKYFWILALSAFLFIAKNFWVSGWIPILGRMPVEFAIPHEAKSFLKYISTFYTYEGRNNLPFNSDLIFGVLYLGLIAIQSWLNKQNKKPWLKNLIVHFLILGYWVFYAPAGRYLLPFFLIILLTIPLKANFKPHPTIYFPILFLLIGLFSVLPQWGSLLTNARAQRLLSYGGVNNIHWITPSPLWQPQTKPIDLEEGFTYYLPIEPYLCFDANFPCNPRILRYYNGDSVYLPVFHKESYSFSYKSYPIDNNTQAFLDSLSILPQFPLKDF